jgi:hypothetical protein
MAITARDEGPRGISEHKSGDGFACPPLPRPFSSLRGLDDGSRERLLFGRGLTGCEEMGERGRIVARRGGIQGVQRGMRADYEPFGVRAC